MDFESLQKVIDSQFSALLGMQLREAGPERITASLVVRKEICTVGGVLHGGAMMSFADTLGAVGTALNLPAGARTTTLESKTNFFRAAPLGATVLGECLPLHRGRSTMVWQTRVTLEDGTLVGMTTQTQMVLLPGSRP